MEGKTYAHDIPLSVTTEEIQKLAKVVNESGDLHPLRFAISSDGLRSLQQVLELG